MSLAIATDEGSGPLVVLLHGFPELPSSWRHQIAPLRDAGWRVVVPYLRGYGDSPRPADVASYTADILADEVAELIESCGEESAVVVGHDWGAGVTWTSAQLRPDRVRAIAALSVPYTPRSKTPPIERLTAVFAGEFFYMLHFQAEGVADIELAKDVRRTLLGVYADPTEGNVTAGATFVDRLPQTETLPAFIDADEFAEHVATFERTGFTGALNYYRAMDPNWHKLPELGTKPIDMPVTFIAGQDDIVLAFTPMRSMGPPHLTDLRGMTLVPGAGHWVQQQAPDAVNAALIAFLGGL
ncbi:MAG: alpha/beta fold hydrolase [Acidimicrobiales bacterium]